MYARFTLHTADPARLGEVINHYEHDVAEVFTHEPGSRGMSVLVNDDLGVTLVKAYWSTEEAMRSNDATFADPIHDAAFFGATVSIERYEVVKFVHVAPARPGAAVSLTRLEFDPPMLDAVRAVFDDAAVAPLTVCDGFCSAAVFVDGQNGRSAAEITWRDGDALIAARGVAADLRLQAVSGGTPTVRGIEQYRVDFHSVEVE